MRFLPLLFTISDVGLWRDRHFHLALAGAPLLLVCVAFYAPSMLEGKALGMVGIAMLLLWQPLIEEILFRGFIQGALEQTRFGDRQVAGITVANVFTSLLFATAHLVHQSPIWAMLVFFPSLVFGYFRTRHEGIAAPILLHVAYNGFYLLFAFSV